METLPEGQDSDLHYEVTAHAHIFLLVYVVIVKKQRGPTTATDTYWGPSKFHTEWKPKEVKAVLSDGKTECYCMTATIAADSTTATSTAASTRTIHYYNF